MKYIIDTDILIYFLKKNEKVVESFSKINDKNIFTTIINYTELLFGAYNSLKVDQNLKKFKSFLFLTIFSVIYTHSAMHTLPLK